MFDGMIPLLALFTLLAVLVLALIAKERTKDRLRDPNAPTSTLAKDGKFGGVAFLRPLAERAADPRDPLSLPPRPLERRSFQTEPARQAAEDRGTVREVSEDRVNRNLY
jgi:hypothetical protein